MKRWPDGIMIEMSEQEREDISSAYSELCWHVQNVLAELGGVMDNRVRTEQYCIALKALVWAYNYALRDCSCCSKPYKKPDYRATVEEWIRDKFAIDHYADILPRTKVRGVATGNGSFELGENQ